MFSAQRIEQAVKDNSGCFSGILNNTNYKQFIEQLTSHEGYFLITIFQFYTEQGEQKLDDAILHALFNGKLYCTYILSFQFLLI